MSNELEPITRPVARRPRWRIVLIVVCVAPVALLLIGSIVAVSFVTIGY